MLDTFILDIRSIKTVCASGLSVGVMGGSAMSPNAIYFISLSREKDLPVSVQQVALSFSLPQSVLEDAEVRTHEFWSISYQDDHFLLTSPFESSGEGNSGERRTF
jgi:hypothetical protein